MGDTTTSRVVSFINKAERVLDALIGICMILLSFLSLLGVCIGTFIFISKWNIILSDPYGRNLIGSSIFILAPLCPILWNAGLATVNEKYKKYCLPLPWILRIFVPWFTLSPKRRIA